MGGNTVEAQKSGGGLLIFLLSLAAAVIVPLFLAVSLLSGLLTCSGLYTGILKNADLIETYIEATNLQVENKIKREIERKVHLEEFRDKFEAVKADYENKKKIYNELNRTEEYNELVKQRDELSDLSWDRAPERFKAEDDFKDYKEKELERLDRAIDEIRLFRDVREDDIERAEEEMENALDEMEDEQDVLEDKIDDANDIIASYKESFMGEVYSDIGKISPALTEELNSKLIERAVKDEVEKLIDFFSNYYEQKEFGNVYIDRLDDFLTDSEKSVKIRLPAISISLWVEDEINGVVQRRHLLSEIFIDRINEIDDLKNRRMFIKLFRFADSGMAELLGESYLKEYNFSVKDGVIKSEPVLLKGSAAEIVEKIMIAVTWSKYLKYILPVIALALLMSLAAAAKKRDAGYGYFRWVLILPSLIIVAAIAAVYLLSGRVFSLFPELVKSPVMRIYYISILDVALIHLLAPVAVLFTLLFISGMIFKRKGGIPA